MTEEVLLFLMPLWFINTLLNIFHFIPILKKIDKPLDFDSKFIDHNRILGDSTTLIGLPVALSGGLAASLIINKTLIYGIILGASCYLGHACGSFIKRRLNIPDGKYLPFVDHLNYVYFCGTLLLILDYIKPTIFLYALLLNSIAHPILCFLGYKVGLRKNMV